MTAPPGWEMVGTFRGPAGPPGPPGADSAVAGPPGAPGTSGADGRTILSGTVNPTSALGVMGDFYINTATSTLFGPRGSTSWPTGISLTGPAGTPGTAGTNGMNGADGRTILSGTTNPAAGTGVQGDFFINTATSTLFGPRGATSWPSPGTSLIGPTGPQGNASTVPGPPGPPGGTYNVTISATAPPSPSPGDIWIDTS